MAFRNKRKHRHRDFRSSLKSDLRYEIESAIENGAFSEALSLLDKAVRDHPSDVQFWELLAEVAVEVRDNRTMLTAYSRLTQMQPRDPTAWLGLASAYAVEQWPALAYRGFREFIRRFPKDPRRPEVESMVRTTEAILWQRLASLHFPTGEDGLELACLFEDAQVLMNLNRLEEAREKAEELIGQMPDFYPAYNNLSLILFAEGDVEKAVDAARAVLVKHPTNCHAHANLVRFLIFLGRVDHARTFADKLKILESDAPDIFIKKIEAFSFLGDDAAVVDVFKSSKKRPVAADDETAMIHHLAAYSIYRLGDEKKARRLWREIVDENPYFEFAVKNLDELELPKHERETFALPLTHWLPSCYIESFVKSTRKIKDLEKNLARKTAEFFEKNPGIPYVLSLLLDRSDADAKEFAIKILSWAGTSESHAALKEFALGQNGSDQMRYKAAMALREAGALPAKVRLWHGGEWRDQLLMVYEISGEPVKEHPMRPKAEAMYAKGIVAMGKDNYDLAEQYFRKAVEAHGTDHPSLIYNLIAVDLKRGNELDAETRLEELTKQFPDYFFAAATLATIKARKGEIETASRLTGQFYDKTKWHTLEARAWFYLNMELALAEKKFDGARSWLEMLAEFDQNVDVDYWKGMITRKEMADKFSVLASRKSRKPRKAARRKGA